MQLHRYHHLRTMNNILTNGKPNRPFSVQSALKAKIAEDGKESTTQRRLVLENGHPGVEIDEAAIRRGENPYTKYYVQQGEQMPVGGAGAGAGTGAAVGGPNGMVSMCI